jgi:Flp pilus assembly protein TadD, contains TPR repeats
VAGMKPRILCAHCSVPLQPGNQFCSSCGVAVDWTVEIASGSPMNLRMESTKLELRGKKIQPKKLSTSWLLKSILGVVVIAAVVVIGYEFFIEKSPSTGSTQQVLAQPMTLTGEMAQKQAEIQALEKDVTSHPNDMVLTLQLANSLHDGLFYERAIPYYKMFLAKNPSDANARVDLGICYKELGNFSEAKKEMKEALKYVPKHLHANFNLGIVCLSEGNLHEANEWFRKTVALDPTSEVGKRAQQLLTQHNSQTPKTN